ncbi:hypothetical protein L6452_01659 [Arctium lappa]|uniref:Uncharacterized protein n=1 Tax=Arctium lappa TaxID=4217 RepID=A0ACB9FIA7_ARCLA|nr:hypothetical protein L6452_01659 [Arctium lappa]
MVINMEYNQLDPLLRATGYPDGDANCETGYSLYPGNINQLILEVGPYMDELSKTGGVIKEFVNPKLGIIRDTPYGRLSFSALIKHSVIDALLMAIEADVRAGLVPLYLCLTVGITQTITTDPIGIL